MTQSTVRASASSVELRRAVSAAALLTGVTAVNSVGNLLVHVLVARASGVDNYGAVGTLLSLGIIASTVAAGIQYAVTRRSSLSPAPSASLLLDGYIAASPWLVILALTAVFSPIVASFLHLLTPVAVLLALAYCGALIMYAVAAGVLIGRRRIQLFAILTASTTALRLAFGFLLGWGSTDGVGPLASSALAVATATLVAVVLGVRIPIPAGVVASSMKSIQTRVGLAAEGATGAILSSLLWASWTVPLLFARHFLSAGPAGDFASAQLILGSILFLTAGLATGFYPTIVRSQRVRFAVIGLAATIVVAALAALAAVLIGPLFLKNVYGRGFIVSPSLFLALGLSVTTVAGATYALWMLQALHRCVTAFAAGVTAALVVEIVLGQMWHGTPVALGLGPAAGCAFGALVGLGTAGWQRTGNHKGTEVRLRYAGTRAEGRIGSDQHALSRTAVGVMVHNEEAMIGSVLEAILSQSDGDDRVASVVVVASGCTDETEAVVLRIRQRDPRVRLLSEPHRSGKASAINLFLRETDTPMCALVGGDVLLAPGSLQQLLAPLDDPAVGMTGAHVIPTNRRNGLAGRLAHVLWELHHQIAMRRPKLGEACAFRRVVNGIDESSITDEASLEAAITGAGLRLTYCPEAIVFNHGAQTLADYFEHRQRIYAGHLGVRATTSYAPSTMDNKLVIRAIVRLVIRHPSAMPTLAASIAIEFVARSRAWRAHRIALGSKDGIWQPISSAKNAFHVDYASASLTGHSLLRASAEVAAEEPV